MISQIIIPLTALIVGVASTILIKRQSRVNDLNRSVQNTIESIQNGRNHKVAIIEDFADHERLANDLLPYLLFGSRRKTEQAIENYRAYRKNIDELGPATLFASEVRPEVDNTIEHLKRIRKKI